MYYVYVIQSLFDKSLYTGFTVDLSRRLQEHNAKCQISTKSRIPFRLVYYEWSIDKKDAVSREKYLKSGMGKKYLRNRIKYFLDSAQ